MCTSYEHHVSTLCWIWRFNSTGFRNVSFLTLLKSSAHRMSFEICGDICTTTASIVHDDDKKAILAGASPCSDEQVRVLYIFGADI